MTGVDRRGFLELTGASAVAALGGTQLEPDPARNFDAYGLLIGPSAARPDPNGQYFSEFDTYQFAYYATDGGAYTTAHHTDGWQGPYAFQPGVKLVASQANLPAPTNGVHELDGTSAYFFTGFVDSPYSIDPNGSPLIGYHGAVSGFIHTGGQSAFTSSSGMFMRDFYAHAPGGTIFDLDASTSTEFLIESSSFSDAAGIAPIASLGNITGYRVPSFKGCNFEGFNAGLTFDGSPDKIYVSKSPFRGVTASGVTCLTLASSIDVQIIDFPGNYFKDVQADTEVWRIESGAEPTEVFQYRGNTHDASVTKSNILTGPNAGKDREPYVVSQSFPLAKTSVVGELHNTQSGTVTINTQDTYTLVDVPSTADTLLRYQKAADGKLQYVGVKDEVTTASANLTFYGSSNNIYTFAIARNGTVLQQHSASVEARGQNANIAVPINALFELLANDTISLQVKNESGTNDAEILSYSLSGVGE